MDEFNVDVLWFFGYAHLPSKLQQISKPFCVLARELVQTLPPSSEREMALRKLLEAKDCAVRAATVGGIHGVSKQA